MAQPTDPAVTTEPTDTTEATASIDPTESGRGSDRLPDTGGDPRWLLIAGALLVLVGLVA